MTGSRPAFRVALAMAAAFALVAANAFATDNPPPATTQTDNLPSSHSDIDRSKIERAEPGKEWWRDVVARFPNCTALTDGCQSCVPNGDTLTCSNPGIACTRTEWRCSAEIKPLAEPKTESPARDATPAPKQ
jgi:hypothetical protein